MQKLHPVELLLIAALLVAEALCTLAVAGVALVGALLPRSPRPAPAPVAPAPAPPQPHPLALVAAAAEAALAPSTVAQLRRQARAVGLPRQLSRTGRRAELVAALVGLQVAVTL